MFERLVFEKFVFVGKELYFFFKNGIKKNEANLT